MRPIMFPKPLKTILRGTPIPGVRSPGRGGIRTTALIVSSALLMEQLDSTVLSTALPTMAHTFGVDPLHMNVALTAYLLSLAVFIPASGKLADRFGSRTVFRGAIALFTLGSIFCGQADSLVFLVGARILQGIGGAMMVPVGRLVLLRTVAKSDLVAAMAWLLIPATIGPVLGPPVGGFIVTFLSWRWIFYINVPIGIAGMVMATLFIEDVPDARRARFDLIGLVLSGISLACLMFGIEMASHGAGSAFTTVPLLGVGLVGGALYVFHAHRHPEPVLDFRLLRIPTFGLSVLGGSLSRISAGALPFLLPMMLQLGFGMSASRSGLITFASAGGSLAMRMVATPLLRRFGFRSAMVWNGLVSTSLLFACAFFRPSWPIAAIYAVLGVGGFLQSLQFIAYNTIAYADVSSLQMSSAISFYTTFQQLMLTLGICSSAGVLAASMVLHGHARPQLSDFSVAFVSVGLVSLLASPACSRLPRNAGEELSGHHIKGRR
jgi:EmrB/QacA subfamily drug resistance transporter